MSAYHPILHWLKERNLHLSNRQLTSISRHTLLRKAKAKELLMIQDEVVQKCYFLNKGIVRLYRTHEGTDHTLGLINSHDFLAAPQLVLSKEISTCSLEALTDLDLLEWDSNAIHAINSIVPDTYNVELALMARLLNWVQQNQVELVCFPAEKRYQMMLERQPDVVLNIPLKYIASFLGIHTDSLSRIRKAASH